MNKIFVIGFNKSATKTFHNLFLKNNLKSQHDGKQWDLKYYDCFSDNGNNRDIPKLYRKYPNSIFILNTRRLDKWLISRFKHGYEKNSINNKNNWAYPCTKKKCLGFINERYIYYKKILEFFEDKSEKLIIVNIDNNDWIKFITSELNLKKYDIKSFNISNDIHKRYLNKINYVIDKSFNKLEYNNREKKNVLFNDRNLYKKYLKLYRNNLI